MHTRPTISTRVPNLASRVHKLRPKRTPADAEFKIAQSNDPVNSAKGYLGEQPRLDAAIGIGLEYSGVITHHHLVSQPRQRG